MKRAREIQRNKIRRELGTKEIMKLSKMGYQIEALNDFHFRINNTLDLYPTNRRFHNICTNQRGYYGELVLFVAEKQIGIRPFRWIRKLLAGL